MALSMARPTRRPGTRFLQARKVVPEALRPIIGRREFTRSLRADDQAELKRLHRAALDEWERQIAAAKAQVEGKVVRLTFKEVQAVAGAYYREQVGLWEAEPGDPYGWEAMMSLLSDEVPGYERGDEPPPFVPSARRIALAEGLLREQGIAADSDSVRRVAVALFETDQLVARTLERRARGDYGEDEFAEKFPTLERPQIAPVNQRPSWTPL